MARWQLLGSLWHVDDYPRSDADQRLLYYQWHSCRQLSVARLTGLTEDTINARLSWFTAQPR